MAKAKKTIKDHVLVSWVAVNNDPFERDGDGQFRKLDGSLIPGPTLTLLENDRSPYAGKIGDIVLFRTSSRNNQRAHRSFLDTSQAIADRINGIKVHWRTTIKAPHQRQLKLPMR